MKKRHPHKRAIPADERKRLRLKGKPWWRMKDKHGKK